MALGAKALTVSQSSPLVVPVYPLHSKKGALPKGADLRDSYVVLKDGSVMSVADWILGALKSDQGGVGMSDYENRLFLGQVARALVGQDEKLVDRTPVPQPVAGLAAAAGQAPFRIGPFTIDGSTVGGNRSLQSGAPRGITVLNDAIGTSFTDEISIGKTALLEDPYSTAFAGAVEDFKLHGTFMNMLHDYEKREPKGNNQGSK
ncbi:hypothetical protein [Kordiimonas marina]|uniref:hypothetical protein n=1 Tax=Kordiimonas marina TaxID=2872312 RepID=UPI001FF687DA|nr:hypothetical protein [Kordiimonas marina]MCJ9427440.1 hypothetical protein [Kordiimonas marina]